MNDINPSAGSASSRGSSIAIPIAIILGFGLIAAAIYFSGSSKAPAAVNPAGTGQEQPADLSAMAPITAEDHIKGNPNAPLVIVEYADFDCPFCRSFHGTLQKIIDEYGPGGQVAWVYRHFPLTSLHPSAAHIAEVSECVAELGGNEAFWTFADLVFSERLVDPVSSREMTDLSRLPEFAATAGVDEADLTACVDSGRHKATVESDYNNAVATGGNGTPFTVIVVGDQKFEITGGAQPYEVVKQMVDGLLKQG